MNNSTLPEAYEENFDYENYAATLSGRGFVMPSRENVLLLGGNGLIGAETASQLVDDGGCNMTLLCRGTAYFDAAQRVFPHARLITCDRHGPLTELTQLTAQLKRWDFVIDFSALNGTDVKSVLAVLGGSVGHYIYISSDSVYEVSAPGGGGPSVEEDARRPDDPAERARLAAADPYGDGKLAVEEALAAAEVSYTALRLPDVLGPRDTTYRWWVHQAWLQYAQYVGRPVPVTTTVNTCATSYVYVADVARVIRTVMARVREGRPPCGAFNISLDRSFTLPQLLSEIAEELGVTGSLTEVTDDPKMHGFLSSVIYTLPSVFRGPINIERARRELGFEPTAWQQVRKDLVSFYLEAFHRFPKERQVVLDNLKHMAMDEDHRHQLEDVFRRDLEKSSGSGSHHP